MATGRAYLPVNIPTTVVWYGTLQESSANRIVISDGIREAVYEGQFTYSFLGVSGTLEKYTEYRNGDVHYYLDDIGSDARKVYQAVQLQGDFELSASINLAGDDKLIGSSGDDDVNGFAGDDKLYGKDGDDTLRGDKGRDRLLGQDGRDHLLGGSQSDDLRGGNGWDKLVGGSGNDNLKGGRGKDVLIGGSGKDTHWGGKNDDTFVFRKDDGRDTIKDFTPGADEIEIRSGASKFSKLDIDRRGDDTVITFADTQIKLIDVRPSDLDAGDFVFS
ncbi:MAG: calcium-binding protein [Pseudomonadota bacterium]